MVARREAMTHEDGWRAGYEGMPMQVCPWPRGAARHHWMREWGAGRVAASLRDRIFTERVGAAERRATQDRWVPRIHKAGPRGQTSRKSE